MKKLIITQLIILMCIFTNTAFAQYDSFPAPPGYVDDEFPLYPSDSFYTISHGSIYPIDTTRINPKTTCLTPMAIDAASIVHYNNGIVAYVELDTFISGLSYFKQQNDGPLIAYALSSNEVILNELLADTKYTLSVINSCLDTVIMSIFNTDQDSANAQSLEINAKLYKYLSIWQSSEDTTNLYSYLQSIPNLHNIEKTSFLQRWFMSDTILTLVPSIYNFNDVYLLPPNTIFSKRGDCNCKFIIRTSLQTSPTDIDIDISPAEIKPWGSIWGVYKYEEGAWGGNGNWYFGRNSKGPAKSHFLDAKGKGPDKDITSYAGKENNTPYYVTRQMSYTCVDNSLYQDDCACDRTVNVKYLYEGVARAKAIVTTCGTCLNKDAYSQVEDWAVVSYRYNRSGETKVIAANNVGAYAEQKYKVNKEFLLGAVDIGVNVGLIYGIISTGVPMPGLIDTVANTIKKIINLPPFGIGNAFQESPVDFQLLNSSQDVPLPVNDPIIVMLSSHSTHNIHGKGSFETYNGVASNFLLSLRHNFDTESLPSCCGPSVGTWAVATYYPQTQKSITQLQNLVTSHYRIYGDWWTGQSVGIDFGSLEGKKIPGCTTEYRWDLKTKNDEGNSNNKMDVIPSINSSLVLKLEKNLIDNSELTEYTIFDIQGKVLKQGFASSGETIWQNNPFNLEMIFVRLQNSTGSITKKFVFVK